MCNIVVAECAVLAHFGGVVNDTGTVATAVLLVGMEGRGSMECWFGLVCPPADLSARRALDGASFRGYFGVIFHADQHGNIRFPGKTVFTSPPPPNHFINFENAWEVKIKMCKSQQMGA